jgi:squalene-hopene/tetraprenyl-beta-curcumene cyclase
MKGKGPSTPSQTAWGLIGLLAAAEPNDPATLRALRFLLEHQKESGTWAESGTTGTGFPAVFHLTYHLYRVYFPVYALARYRNVVKGAEPFCGVLVSPHQFERRNGSRVNR